MESIYEMIEADGYNPQLLLGLYDMMSESAVAAVKSRRGNDVASSLICFGRVTAIFDVLVGLGYPTPADSPSEVMDIAESEYDAMAEANADEPDGEDEYPDDEAF